MRISFFLFIDSTGVTLVNNIIPVPDAQFHSTSPVHCTGRAAPKSGLLANPSDTSPANLNPEQHSHLAVRPVLSSPPPSRLATLNSSYSLQAAARFSRVNTEEKVLCTLWEGRSYFRMSVFAVCNEKRSGLLQFSLWQRIHIKNTVREPFTCGSDNSDFPAFNQIIRTVKEQGGVQCSIFFWTRCHWNYFMLCNFKQTEI